MRLAYRTRATRKTTCWLVLRLDSIRLYTMPPRRRDVTVSRLVSPQVRQTRISRIIGSTVECRRSPFP